MSIDNTIDRSLSLSKIIAKKEIDQLMPIIHDAQNIKQISEEIEKTPASVTKYSSKYGFSMNYQINTKHAKNLSKNML